MLIDCDTCAVRGEGCADCVVSVLLGAPPGQRGPVVVPLRTTRPGADHPDQHHPVQHHPDHRDDHRDDPHEEHGVVVELDEVERRAVRALADVGLVPPLRHRTAEGGAAGGR